MAESLEFDQVEFFPGISLPEAARTFCSIAMVQLFGMVFQILRTKNDR